MYARTCEVGDGSTNFMRPAGGSRVARRDWGSNKRTFDIIWEKSVPAILIFWETATSSCCRSAVVRKCDVGFDQQCKMQQSVSMKYKCA